MTNQDYEDHYNAVLEIEYEKITLEFIKAYNNTENGLIISERIFDFRNQLNTRIERLILIRKSPNYQNYDWYYKNLIETFKRRSSYLKDQFFNKFFEKLVPELKETLKRNNFEILLPEIYNANNKDTLSHIAIYNAHKKFIDTFPTSEEINYDEIKDINAVLNILTGKNKTIINKTQKNLKTIDQIKRSGNNFVKRMSMKQVIDHFMVLTTRKSKNGSPFLTETEFISFLQKAFLSDTNIPVQKINFARGEKGFVIKRFYEFFDLAVKHFHEPNKKKKYIDLLANNFENWTEDEIIDFFKPNKSKENW
ncbi:MAG: hypothetical protein ABIP51_16270 [Bacteroidia bacterium]